MKVFLKFILKSMVEKKTQFILLTLAVILSSTLVVASFGLTDVINNSFSATFTKIFDGRNVSIKSETKDPLIDLTDVKLKGVKDVLPEFWVNGVIKENSMKTNISVTGMENKYIKDSLRIEGNKLGEDFTGQVAIISKRIADDRGLKVGDTISLLVNGETLDFKIYSIYANDSFFYSDTKDNFTMIVPYKYLSAKYNVEGKYNNVIATSTEKVVEDGAKIFNDNNSDYTAKELVNAKMMEEVTSMISRILMVLSSVVILLSIIIIFTSFKLIITERIPVIGTFLSQGATKGKIVKILLMESTLYGLFGGVLAFALGSSLIKLIAYYTSPLREYGILNVATIYIKYLYIAVGFGVALSVISALLPIISIRKLPVKDVILGKFEPSYKASQVRFYRGLVVLAAGIISNFLSLNKWVTPILLLIALILLVKKIIEVSSGIIYKLLRDRLPVLALSFNNLRVSKELMNSVTLMLIAVISVTTINSISKSMVDIVVGAYGTLNYDIEVGARSTSLSDNTSKIINDVLKKNDSVVSDSIQVVSDTAGEFGENKFFLITGVDENKFLEQNDYLDWSGKEETKAYNDFKESDKLSVIITTALNKEINAKKGDKIKVKIGNVEEEAIVSGFIDGKILKDGYFMLMKNSDIKKYYGSTMRDGIQFKVKGDVDKAKLDIASDLEKYDVTITTLEDQKERNLENNQMLITVISIFALLAGIIASFGVLNNIGISYLNSKKTIALLTSLGLNKGQRARLLIYQGLIVVFWVSLLTMPFTIVISKLLTILVRAADMPIDIVFNIGAMPMVVISLTLITLLATIPSLFKGKKISVIDELKYE